VVPAPAPQTPAPQPQKSITTEEPTPAVSPSIQKREALLRELELGMGGSSDTGQKPERQQQPEPSVPSTPATPSTPSTPIPTPEESSSGKSDDVAQTGSSPNPSPSLSPSSSPSPSPIAQSSPGGSSVSDWLPTPARTGKNQVKKQLRAAANEEMRDTLRKKMQEAYQLELARQTQLSEEEKAKAEAQREALRAKRREKRRRRRSNQKQKKNQMVEKKAN
jgi:hypothetical protein